MSNSLALFEQGAAMLAQADTIQKAKELKDLSLTAADWAQRREMGDGAVLYARSYALEAERRMGELLAQTERAKGTLKHVVPTGHRDEKPQTLAELGVSKKESSRAQAMASLPRATFDEVKNGKKTIAAAVKEQKPAKAPPPAKASEPEPEEQPDMAAEFESLAAENTRLARLNESLSKSDLGSQVKIWSGKFDALNGRVQQMMETENQLKRTATHQEKLLKSIRELLAIDKNNQILATLKERLEK